jgi:hypothetical protein
MIPRDTGSQTERLTKRRKRIAEQAFAFEATSGQRPKLPGPWRDAEGPIGGRLGRGLTLETGARILASPLCGTGTPVAHHCGTTI